LIHKNIWSPDTCECQIEFEFDDELPPESREHKASKVIKKCPAHSTTDIIDHHDHYDTVLKENKRKNILLGKMVEAHPELAKIGPDGSKNLKDDIDYIHSFTGTGKNRVLEVEFAGQNFTFLKKHKDKIKEISDTEFGPNKVVVR